MNVNDPAYSFDLNDHSLLNNDVETMFANDLVFVVYVDL